MILFWCLIGAGMAQSTNVAQGDTETKDKRPITSVYDIVNLDYYPDTADLPKKYKDLYMNNPTYMEDWDSLMFVHGSIPEPVVVKQEKQKAGKVIILDEGEEGKKTLSTPR